MSVRWWDNVMAAVTNQQTTSKSKMPEPGRQTGWQQEALEQQQMQIAQLWQNQAYITRQTSQMQSYMEAQERSGSQYHPVDATGLWEKGGLRRAEGKPIPPSPLSPLSSIPTGGDLFTTLPPPRELCGRARRTY